MIHLDTNFFIDSLVAGSPQEAKLVGLLASGETVEINSVAWGEFFWGPLSASADAAARLMLPNAESFGRADAEQAARLFNLTGRRSKSYADCRIAAVALRVGASLATSNRADFTPMAPHGLRLV